MENFKWPYLSNVLSDSLYVCTQTILCRRSLIYNDGDSKLISGSKWPIYGIQRKNKKQILRNSRENKREEYTLDWSQSKVFLVAVWYCSFGVGLFCDEKS